ncbi:hypothetical protein ACQEVF_51710 [Nonomuraea polychroma]|uniref:hypothetical protein n=1 Tax=Nonomuraea polychroma TaxID=46176 RepID=UPI003D8D4150
MGLEVVDAAGALSEADLNLELDLAVGHGAGLRLIRRLCDEVRLEGVAASARPQLRLHRRTDATA